jgi:hypothetical protein
MVAILEIKNKQQKKIYTYFNLTASNLRTNFLILGVASFPASQLLKQVCFSVACYQTKIRHKTFLFLLFIF